MASITNELKIAQGQYALESMAQKNNILASGLVFVEGNPVFAGGGSYMTVPYLASLDGMTAMERITGSTTITPQTFDNFEVTTPIIYRGAGIRVANYELNREGLVKALGLHSSQVNEFYNQDVQGVLKSVLKGAFGSSSGVYSTHVLDYTTTGFGTLGKQAVSKARQLLGETGTKFNKMIVHSDVYADIEDACVSYDSTQYPDSVVAQGTVKVFMGMQIVINDTICEPTDGNYPVYLAYGTPLYLGFQVNMEMYDIFDPALAGGTHSVYFYARYGVGLSSLSFDKNSTNPTNTTLEDSTKYTFPFSSPQQLTMVKLIVKSAYGVA